MKITIEPPQIIGALCNKESEIPIQLIRKFSKFKPKIAFLPFEVEKRHLKNTVTCMQLMDIRGLVVFGELKKEITRHLSSHTPAAGRADEVDVVIRKRKQFVGHHALSEACMRWAKGKKLHKKAIRPLIAITMGCDRYPKGFGFRLRKSDKTEIMGLFYQIIVELLTHR